jgi:ferredoxin
LTARPVGRRAKQIAQATNRKRDRREPRESSRRDQREAPMPLKIHVDQDKCQGHARCKSLAPELFNLDEYGNAHEVGDGTVPAGLEDKAYLAQSNCPEIAIKITED